jgi:hypothetical protein
VLAVTPRALPGMRPSAVASTVWAVHLVTTEPMPDALTGPMFAALERAAPAMSPQSVATSLWPLWNLTSRGEASATVVPHAAALGALLAAAEASAPAMNACAVTSTLWALRGYVRSSTPLSAGLVLAMQRAVQRTAPDMMPRDVSEVAWALGNVSPRPSGSEYGLACGSEQQARDSGQAGQSAHMRALLAAAERRAPAMSPDEVVRTLDGLSVMAGAAEALAGARAALLRALRRGAPQLDDAVQVARALSALATLQWRPLPPGLQAALIRGLARNAGDTPAPVAACALGAAAALRARPSYFALSVLLNAIPAGLRAPLAAAAARAAGAMSPAHVIHLLQALTALHERPAPRLAAVLSARVEAIARELAPAEACRVLYLLAEVQVEVPVATADTFCEAVARALPDLDAQAIAKIIFAAAWFHASPGVAVAPAEHAFEALAARPHSELAARHRNRVCALLYTCLVRDCVRRGPSPPWF